MGWLGNKIILVDHKKYESVRREKCLENRKFWTKQRESKWTTHQLMFVSEI